MDFNSPERIKQQILSQKDSKTPIFLATCPQGYDNKSFMSEWADLVKELLGTSSGSYIYTETKIHRIS